MHAVCRNDPPWRRYRRASHAPGARSRRRAQRPRRARGMRSGRAAGCAVREREACPKAGNACVALPAQNKHLIRGSGYIQFPPQVPFRGPVVVQPPTVAVRGLWAQCSVVGCPRGGADRASRSRARGVRRAGVRGVPDLRAGARARAAGVRAAAAAALRAAAAAAAALRAAAAVRPTAAVRPGASRPQHATACALQRPLLCVSL
jgi:hypothetical protein